MAKMYYAKFHYEGKKPLLNDVVEGLFVSVYSRYCDAVNPLIEEWNNTFDKENPDLEEDRWDPNSKSARFFREHEDQVIKALEDDLDILTCSMFKRFYSGKDLEFRGVLYDGTEMYFTLEEVGS